MIDALIDHNFRATKHIADLSPPTRRMQGNHGAFSSILALLSGAEDAFHDEQFQLAAIKQIQAKGRAEGIKSEWRADTVRVGYIQDSISKGIVIIHKQGLRQQ